MPVSAFRRFLAGSQEGKFLYGPIKFRKFRKLCWSRPGRGPPPHRNMGYEIFENFVVRKLIKRTLQALALQGMLVWWFC